MSRARVRAGEVPWDRRLATPLVISVGLLCVTWLFTYTLHIAAELVAAGHDPGPLLEYLGPVALSGVALTVLNGTGVLALLPKLGRIERAAAASVPAGREPWDAPEARP